MYGCPPRQTQVNRERGRRCSVSGDVPQDHVDRRVLGLHDVVEVAAQERVGPARDVTRGGVEVISAERRRGKKSPFKGCALSGTENVSLYGGYGRLPRYLPQSEQVLVSRRASTHPLRIQRHRPSFTPH